MRLFFTFSLLFVFFASLNAQKNNTVFSLYHRYSQRCINPVHAEKANTLQQLDSVIDYEGATLAPDVKTLYIYDNQKQIARTNRYQWESGGWRLTSYELYYISNNATDSVHRYLVDPIGGSQMLAGRDLIYYNAQGKLTEEIFMKYDGNNSYWYQDQGYYYTYDGSGKIIEIVLKQFDFNTLTAINNQRETFYYNSAGKDTLMLRANWEHTQMQWNNTARCRKTYDANQLQISEEQASWNIPGSFWENNYKYLYTYDVNENLLTSVYQLWDVNYQWVNQSKDTNFYTSDTKIKTLVYGWSGSIWNPIFMNTYSYDGNFNIVKEVGQIYNSLLSVWDTNLVTDYTFNTIYSLQSIILPDLIAYEEFEYNYNSMLTEMLNYKRTGVGQYTNQYKTLYFYSPVEINSAGLYPEDILKFYPNPASDMVKIEIPVQTTFEYIMFDISGNKIKTEFFTGSGYINTSDIPSGMYVIQVRLDGNISRGKLTVIR